MTNTARYIGVVTARLIAVGLHPQWCRWEVGALEVVQVRVPAPLGSYVECIRWVHILETASDDELALIIDAVVAGIRGHLS